VTRLLITYRLCRRSHCCCCCCYYCSARCHTVLGRCRDITELTGCFHCISVHTDCYAALRICILSDRVVCLFAPSAVPCTTVTAAALTVCSVMRELTSHRDHWNDSTVSPMTKMTASLLGICLTFTCIILNQVACRRGTSGTLDNSVIIVKILQSADFIRQMTGLTSLRILASERRLRFFSKLHQSSLCRTLMPLFYDRMF